MFKTDWTRLYARGFLLSPSRTSLLEDLHHYHVYELNGYKLYADNIVEIGIATTTTGWLVTIGKVLPLSTGAIQSHSDQVAADLMSLFQQDGFTGLERALYDIGGRHAILLMTDGIIYAYNDAAGHRTVYFSDEQARIASHFDMLHRLSEIKRISCPVESKHIDAAPEGMWDLTKNPTVRALLPNHRLSLHDGNQTRFGLMNPNHYSELPWAEKIEIIHQLWHEQLELLVKMSPDIPLGISMSGGLDSRTVLAHMKPYMNRIRAFTYSASNIRTGEPPRNFWERTMVLDHNVLSSMSDHLPQDFHTVVASELPDFSSQEKDVLRRNSIREHGGKLVGHYKQLFPNPNSIHVRGNFVEMGRLIKGRLDIPDQWDRLETIIPNVAWRRKPNMDVYPRFFREKAKQFRYDLIHPDFEYTDAFHWENRSSRWYAEIANETDLAFDSIVPVNVRRIYELLTSPRPDVRRTGKLQVDLIHRAWPELLAFGINEEDDRYSTALRPQIVEQLADQE